ncbi:Phytoene desaturase (neurosporene-forming) [Brevundimonas sp. NIBR10]|uniref:phytoene desaturase family protein n=1 Tax=Brevundimonas sp. NIBR10 TaxID=3015997 RepID=UPI0022F154D0|nr:NAD(P)/FAD-dependent oxidoreductase [Brevundimonas sp. NIBR10]WGM47309.1 Phytoene desaturase (neurosporene-forming) [Brevundimonas sp. NIBR10]
MDDRYDVVIVGGGHNGLIAGTYLSKAGKRVLVVEQAAMAGGLSQSDHVIPEAPDHMINTGTAELIHIRASPVMQELDLRSHGWKTVETDPTYAWLDPEGGSIAVFRDPRRTAEDIARYSKADARAYLEFIELIDGLMQFAGAMGKGDPGVRTAGNYLDLAKVAIRNRALKSKLQLISTAPADQLAAEWFEHPATQALLLGIVAGAGPFDTDGNGIAYALFGLLHRVGVSKAVGGMRMFADALASAYAASGGDLMLNAKVAEIVIRDGATRGVRLTDGQMVEAGVVIATCDPITAARLATPSGLDRVTRTRLEYAPAHRANVGPSLINVASSRPFRLRRHRRDDGLDLNQTVGLIGTADELRQALVQARRGLVPTVPVFSLSPMTNWDPLMAPDGQGVAYIYLPVFPVDVNAGWDTVKAPAAQAIVTRAAEYYDGFDGELGRWFETCPDREARTGLTKGCVTHVDFGAQRTGAKRPAFGLGGPEPLVPGFFLGGAGIHPGGGVSGGPGRLVSKRVLDYLA